MPVARQPIGSFIRVRFSGGRAGERMIDMEYSISGAFIVSHSSANFADTIFNLIYHRLSALKAPEAEWNSVLKIVGSFCVLVSKWCSSSLNSATLLPDSSKNGFYKDAVMDQFVCIVRMDDENTS